MITTSVSFECVTVTHLIRIQLRARARFSQPRQNDASVRDRGKSASCAEQWEVITSVGKKNGVDDLIDATESAAIPVLRPVFLERANHT